MIFTYTNVLNIPANSGLTIVLNGENFSTIQEVYDFLANKLSFPEFFGNNLDALYDSLCDLPENVFPLSIIISNTPALLSSENEDLKDDFICTLSDVATTWIEDKGANFFSVYIQNWEDSQAFYEFNILNTKPI